MKKYLIIISLSLLTVFNSYAQDYYVIHINGGISNKATGTALKVGDKITSKTQVRFANGQSSMVILNSAQGRFTVTPKPSPNNSNEFIAFIYDAILPVKSNGHLSTRGAESDGVIDMKNYFGTTKFIIVGDKLNVKLNTLAYPLSEKQYVIYRYLHKGTVITKKIAYDGNIITIDNLTLYNANGEVIASSEVENVDIYYCSQCDGETKNFKKVTNFIPVFLDEKVLKDELTAQSYIYKNMNLTQDQIVTEFMVFVRDVYGKTDEAVLAAWIKANLQP